jgi:heat shock protein HslJ
MGKIGLIGRVVGFTLLGLIVMYCKSSAPVSDVPDASLQETYWKLTELMGQPISVPDPDKREVHIILKNGNRLQGFAGCNNIMGSFERKNEFSITFSGVASTLMVCPDMTTEDNLKRALEQADNYVIKGNTLSLNKARMAPLARFEAVYLK